MPAVALIAAVGTVSAGAALGGVLGGVMIAGGVMSGIGAVTGNKKLSMLGAVVSLGAGLGSAFGLADSANAAWNSATAGSDALQVTGKSFMADGGVFGAAAAPVDGMMNGSVMNGAGTTTGLQTFGSAPAASGNALNAGTALDATSFGIAPTPGLESALSGGQSAMGAAPSGLVDSATGMATYAPVGAMGPKLPSIGGAVGPQLPSVNGLIGPQLPASPALATANRLPDAVGATTGAGANGGFLSQAKDFLKGNPEVVKAGSGLLLGGLKSYSDQRTLDQQKEAMAAARQAYNDSILNQRTTRRL